MPRPDSPVPDSKAVDAPVVEETVPHHVSIREKRKKKPGQEKMELSLTSMIDVIFLLLIYFVITASFMINEGILSAALPEGPPQPADPLDPKTPVEILLTPAGPDGTQVQIVVEGTTFASFSELYSFLDDQLNAPELGKTGGMYPVDNPMIIKPESEVRWQHVVAAFNALVRAKYEAVSFGQPAPPS